LIQYFILILNYEYYNQPWDANDPRIVAANPGVDWSQCLVALAKSPCAKLRGEAIIGGCIACAEAQRAELTAACGNFSTADEFRGFAVHWYCGIGWPESFMNLSPIAEYCVENALLPPAALDDDPLAFSGKPGYAQYVSCNSDEVRLFIFVRSYD
jgi:hypothetical protein